MASTEAYSQFPSARRPSEASTTSAQSVNTQPTSIEQNQQRDDDQFHAAAAWLAQQQQQNGQLRSIAPAPRPTSPEYILTNGMSVHQARDLSVDAAVSSGIGAQFRFQQAPQHMLQQQQSQPHMARQSLPTEYMPMNGHPGLGTKLVDRNDSPAQDSGLDIGGAPARSRSNTNNDQEMRELFTRNSHRALQDVAKELHGNERGPSSERSRQLFAMLWIKSACRKGKTSVPRSRVYASYVKRCAHEKIAVLNPASFGKLVRVLYPGLRTRRLGVRGESKYHYVDFELVDVDTDDVEELSSQFPVPGPSRSNVAESVNMSNGTRPSTAAEPDNSATPSNNHHATITGEAQPAALKQKEIRHAIYNHPQVSTMVELNTTGSRTSNKLYIQADDVPTSTRFILPPIEPYLPHGTDSDAAKSLEALYLSHCTSLIECIRFCKEKNFFHLFTAFHGTLTVPVQKLLVNPALEPWIEQCDLRMYQNMMHIVAIVALQVIPPFGLQSLRNIAERLVSHIQTSFDGQPDHVLRAKEAPAALFADLLDRALRVNTTAHASANFLHNHANRTQMYLDFVTFVRPRKIAQAVPLEAMEDVAHLLVSEIRQLLDPREVPWDLEGCTVQGDYYFQNRRPSQVDNQGAVEASNLLDRWVEFLKSLPARFPYASTANIVLFVQTIGTTMMRDLTISSAESFGAWWCLKCWIDEMIWFLAEKGGFMQQSTTHAIAAPKRKRREEAEDVESRKSMRYSTGGASEDPIMALIDNPQQVLQPLTPNLKTENQHGGVDANSANYDDSGISLRMSGEDSPMSKFTSQMENQRATEGDQNASSGSLQ
ncbi:hypothetical protein BD289DRAFT_442849 [Coniella lustricola]|uniref:RFX-type winged-helix domain-containing protein n=1 Tax=Coniella lustricola TaxID=2025994 RepID=A0A2T2ZXT7_9PEZI|nr:hypothetical protein BD289DRAFT_442849 [Coniella lustricola]